MSGQREQEVLEVAERLKIRVLNLVSCIYDNNPWSCMLACDKYLHKIWFMSYQFLLHEKLKIRVLNVVGCEINVINIIYNKCSSF